jgi:hypothetical protein
MWCRVLWWKVADVSEKPAASIFWRRRRRFIRNTSKFLLEYTASHSRRRYSASSPSPSGKSHISHTVTEACCVTVFLNATWYGLLCYWRTLPTTYFPFPTIGNNNMAVARTCEAGTTAVTKCTVLKWSQKIRNVVTMRNLLFYGSYLTYKLQNLT